MAAILAIGQRVAAIEQSPPANVDSTDDTDSDDESQSLDSLLPHNHPDRSPLPPADTTTADQREREQSRKQSVVNGQHNEYLTDTGNDIARPNLRKGKISKAGTISYAGSKAPKQGEPLKLCHAPAIDDTTRKVLVEQEEVDAESFVPRKGEQVKLNRETGKHHVWRLKPCKLAAVTANAAIQAIPGNLRLAIVQDGKIVSDVGSLDVTTSVGGSIMLALPRESKFALPIADDTGKGTLSFDAAFYPTASMFVRNDKRSK